MKVDSLPKTENRKPKTGVLQQTKIILEMIKIEHTVFALPFAFMGALLGARGLPTLPQTLFILLAMVGARSAAMAFNRLVDAPFDARNPRTANRALPQGLISRPATVFFIGISALLLFGAASQLNRLSLYLSPVALAVVLFYSYTKRFTCYSHLFLGAALGIAPAAGWIAVRGDLSAIPILLAVSVLFWVAGFDILYALQDEDFDRQVGLHSLPCRFGRVTAMRLASWFHVTAAVGFLVIGWLAELGKLYFGAVFLIVILLGLEHRIISPQDISRLNQAFFTLNGIIGLILGLATLLSFWP